MIVLLRTHLFVFLLARSVIILMSTLQLSSATVRIRVVVDLMEIHCLGVMERAGNVMAGIR